MIDPDGGLLAEHYRLADPFACLVCGGPDPRGRHLCCPREQWGNRFTYPVSAEEKAERVSGLAFQMGITHASAERYAARLRFGDYSDIVELIASSLQEFAESSGHSPDCTECQKSTELSRIALVAIRCPLGTLDVAVKLLSICEDRRHGLTLGDTWAEIERRTREREIAERRQQLGNVSVEDVVARKLARS